MMVPCVDGARPIHRHVDGALPIVGDHGTSKHVDGAPPIVGELGPQAS